MYLFLSRLLLPFTLSFLLSGVALAALWHKRSVSRKRLLCVTIPFVGLMLVSLPATAYVALGLLEWQYPPLEKRPDDVQAIVVLSGYVWPPDAIRPSPELADDTVARCICAAELYHEGPPILIALSGGKVDIDEPGPTLAQAMYEFMLKERVATGDLLKEEQSRTTYENAVETSKLLRQRGIERILLVTDAAHLLRADRCFQREGLTVIPYGCRYRATEFKWSVLSFLPTAEGARDTQRALHEWLGVVWYRLHGRI